MCDPVMVNKCQTNCLMWADDCVVISTTQSGLQRSIDKTVEFFTQQGLSVNTKKTKTMIMNISGHGPSSFPNIKFYIEGQQIESCDSYNYLGIIIKPSGAVSYAAKQLLTKANKAYFAMSNILYENKKIGHVRGLQLFDSLITPICTYAQEYWGLLSLPSNSFGSKDRLLDAWQQFIPESLNQRVCRLLLSVNKKTTRLAVLGELKRYPLLINTILQTLYYKFSIENKYEKDSLAHQALIEMKTYSSSGIERWLTRAGKVEKVFNLSSLPGHPLKEKVKFKLRTTLHSIFDRHWLDKINENKIGEDGLNHNKLRFY